MSDIMPHTKQTKRSTRIRRIKAVAALILVSGVVIWYWQEFCFWRANACLSSRNEHAAARWVKYGTWGRGSDVQTCLLQLRVARRQQRYKDVESGLQLAEKLKAPAAEINRERWLAYAQTQQFDQMQSHWPDLLKDPRDDEPEIARAFVVWACGRHLLYQALDVISSWHADYPLDPEPLALRGQLYMASHTHAAAEQAYRQALSLAPANDEYRLNLAEALRQQLKLDEAAELYLQCLQHKPDTLAAVSGLAQTYMSQGQIDSATEILKEAVARHPDNLDLAQSYGEVLLAAGDNQSASVELQRAYAAHPENSDLAYALGKALKGRGRESEAEPLFAFVAESREQVDQLKDLEEQLRKKPEDLELRMKIASITAKYKSRRDAIRWYENTLNVYPSHAPTHAALAELYRLEGDSTLAAIHLARAGSRSMTAPLDSSSK